MVEIAEPMEDVVEQYPAVYAAGERMSGLQTPPTALLMDLVKEVARRKGWTKVEVVVDGLGAGSQTLNSKRVCETEEVRITGRVAGGLF